MKEHELPLCVLLVIFRFLNLFAREVAPRIQRHTAKARVQFPLELPVSANLPSIGHLGLRPEIPLRLCKAKPSSRLKETEGACVVLLATIGWT